MSSMTTMISLTIPQQQSAEHKRPRPGYLAIRQETTMSEEHAIVSIDGNHMMSIQSITTVYGFVVDRQLHCDLHQVGLS
jgi:hypothetical protein